jgi:hypothetical protein
MDACVHGARARALLFREPLSGEEGGAEQAGIVFQSGTDHFDISEAMGEDLGADGLLHA